MCHDRPLDDITIARQATLLPIEEIAAKAGLPEKALFRYGPTKAKIDLEFDRAYRRQPQKAN